MISFIHIHVYWIMLLHRGGQNREIILGTPFSVVLCYFPWLSDISSEQQQARVSGGSPKVGRQGHFYSRGFAKAGDGGGLFAVCCFVLFFSLALLTLSLSTGS